VSIAIKPREICLEASSLCQLKCHLCPRFTPSFQATIGNGFLKFNDFQKLIDHNPRIAYIELSNYGEIFLNPDLIEIIKYAHAQNVTLNAGTGVNLNDVKEDVLEGLVKYKFGNLTCSIDGASNDSYNIYRMKGNFEKVILNIKKINLLKNKYQSIYPFLRWQFVVFGHNEHELPIARRMAADLGMHFSPKLSWDEDFSPIRDQKFVKEETGFTIVSRKEYKQRFGVDYMQEICNDLWEKPQINWDGKVLGCCRNFWGDFGGNAFRDGLSIAVNNDKIQYARYMLLGKKVPRDDIPCFSCDIYQTMVTNNKFLKRHTGLVKSAYLFLKINKLRQFLRG
jgi:MoaA/NifB/PqqE/SkfB family radical SAM enzyme